MTPPTDQVSPSSPDPLDPAMLAARVRALEEALAFGSHEADQLREHYLSMTRALEALERRLARLEAEVRSRSAGEEREAE